MNKFELPFIADSTFEVYNQFAERMILRNIVIGKDGIIKYHTASYSQESMKLMIDIIKKELEK